MAGLSNMKFWHVTVYEKVVDENGKIKMEQRFYKKCMDVNEANELSKVKKEEYKDKQYTVMRENY